MNDYNLKFNTTYHVQKSLGTYLYFAIVSGYSIKFTVKNLFNSLYNNVLVASHNELHAYTVVAPRLRMQSLNTVCNN